MSENLFNLEGRVALVTGGSRGLGKAMARAFAEAGADVIISSRNESELKAALSEILDGTGSRGVYLTADLMKRSDSEALGRKALEKFGRIDILVNNAGTNIPEPIGEVDDANWDRSIELNLTAGMVLSRTLVGQMKERNWGRIIYISSIMGLASKEWRNSYSATKSAVIGLAKASALELAPFGITVNCIAPGPFLTELPLGLLNDEQKKVASDRTALGRWGNPEEMAGPALLLASDAGSYITGSVLLVDGGLLSKTF
ncbi:MAG: SDR family oxidoreductase [Acidobacteriota bacterium]|nr:MAG: SDR family oxidoreductase [Acidobacteriota bacterium]